MTTRPSAAIGDLPLLGAPSAFGEDFSMAGWTERDVCVGARFGSARTIHLFCVDTRDRLGREGGAGLSELA